MLTFERIDQKLKYARRDYKKIVEEEENKQKRLVGLKEKLDDKNTGTKSRRKVIGGGEEEVKRSGVEKDQESVQVGLKRKNKSQKENLTKVRRMGPFSSTSKLIKNMANEYVNEDLRKNAFINHITEFIGKFIEVKIEDGSSIDRMLLVETACGKNGLRIIYEIKNEIGKRKSDLTI
ncbi:7019_t:CDS:2 [Funneliformis caledonium]|uniref:7019_t:CDS:1 n=1 Tax=Funneliformis caledonium TaxID=1117310 RepID=A0A9N9GG94_9GLOM|nr:7019_t:CDS:2 [Funneliformis caledonium]